MPLKVRNTAKPRELCAEGTYSALCVGHYDIGTHDSQFGKNHQIILMFEIDETNTEGVRFTFPHFTGLNLGSRGQLGKLLKSWLGIDVPQDEEFDTSTLLDHAALVQVVHVAKKDGDVGDRLHSIVTLPRSMNRLVTATQIYDYSPIDPKSLLPDVIPEWIQVFIRESDEWKSVHGEPPQGANKTKQQAKPGSAQTAPLQSADPPFDETAPQNGASSGGLRGSLPRQPAQPTASPEPDDVIGTRKFLKLPWPYSPELLAQALAQCTEPEEDKRIAMALLEPHAVPF